MEIFRRLLFHPISVRRTRNLSAVTDKNANRLLMGVCDCLTRGYDDRAIPSPGKPNDTEALRGRAAVKTASHKQTFHL